MTEKEALRRAIMMLTHIMLKIKLSNVPDGDETCDEMFETIETLMKIERKTND